MDLGVIVQGCGVDLGVIVQGCGVDLGVIVQGGGGGSRCHSPRVWGWI